MSDPYLLLSSYLGGKKTEKRTGGKLGQSVRDN